MKNFSKLKENCHFLTFDRNFGRIGNWDTIDIFDSFSNCFEFLNLTRLDLNFFLKKGSFEVNCKGHSVFNRVIKRSNWGQNGGAEVIGVN